MMHKSFAIWIIGIIRIFKINTSDDSIVLQHKESTKEQRKTNEHNILKIKELEYKHFYKNNFMTKGLCSCFSI